jgi:type VI secretion system protein ImpC
MSPATTPTSVDGDPVPASILKRLISTAAPQTEAEEDRIKSALTEFARKATEAKDPLPPRADETIQLWVQQIDALVTEQMNEVLHSEAFQRLEATWRGLHYLVHQTETGTHLKIRVLNADKDTLGGDLAKAVEFDQSGLFKKVYEDEYGVLGGSPYGLLVGDYEFGRTPPDVAMLRRLAEVAAAAHAPLVAAVSPGMFGFRSFGELPAPRDLAKIFDSVEYAEWAAFRDMEESRYVALTLPRVLSRLPYGPKTSPVKEFGFEEAVDGRDPTRYLWMSAAWAYAARVTDAYAKYGWMARTRGTAGGGKVEWLPIHVFTTDDGDAALKGPTEVAITDRREYELSNLGFLPLVLCKDKNYAVFMGAQSCQKPKEYFEAAATSNAQLSAKFNLVLVTSRFAHYLKVMARDKIGSFLELAEASGWLNRWIGNYVVGNPQDVNEEMKAKYPLSDARVDVRPVPGKPGSYAAVAYLRPHFQLETLDTSLRLVAELPSG